MEKKPVFREYVRNFFILLVTKGSNENAVRRGYNKLLLLEKYHPAGKFFSVPFRSTLTEY
jgi:hypothetical protein